MVQAKTSYGFSRRSWLARAATTFVIAHALWLAPGSTPAVAASERADVLVRNATVVDVIEGRLR
jgi:hypothetical protein